ERERAALVSVMIPDSSVVCADLLCSTSCAAALVLHPVVPTHRPTDHRQPSPKTPITLGDLRECRPYGILSAVSGAPSAASRSVRNKVIAPSKSSRESNAW